MALERGGRADKLGNRYEGIWVAEKTLDVFDGKARSILIEALGDDEKGTEFWIELNNGKRQAYPCKVLNGSKEYWTVTLFEKRLVNPARVSHSPHLGVCVIAP